MEAIKTAALDTATVMARLDAIHAQMAYLVERQKKSEEMLAEMTPILREVMATATTKLDALEKQGYFAFGKELARVGERIVEGFSPDDVRQLGDAIVGILETVRATTQPEVLQIAGEASEVLQNADKTEPLGLVGMVRATRDHDVQQGMAVMMEVMRHVGRAARVVKEKRDSDPKRAQREKLAAALGPRRKKALGTERTPAPAPSPPPAACAVPAKPQPVAAVIDGVAFTADGHLADYKAWNDSLAVKIAASLSIELDAPRWALVRTARADFEKVGAAPNIRRLTQLANLGTKDVYALFPKAPARTVAKIAGIPKPAGCI